MPIIEYMKVIPIPLDALAAGDVSELMGAGPQLKRSLRFSDSAFEDSYQQFIRRKALPNNSCYPSLKERVLIYIILFSIASAFAAVGYISSHIRESLPSNIIAFQSAGLICVVCVNLVLLALIYMFNSSWRAAATLTIFLFILSVIAFTILDSAVSAKFFGESNDNPTLVSFVPVVLVLIGGKHLLVFDHLLYGVSSFGASLLYLGINLAVLARNPVSVVLEFAALAAVSLVQTRRLYSLERVMRVNYAAEMQQQEVREENNVKKGSFSSGGPANSSISIGTDWEEILQRMNNAHAVITEACSMIVYQDLRVKLKAVGKDLDIVAAKLAAEGPNIFHVKVEQINQDIDEDDKLFVQQNFMAQKMSDVNIKPTTQRLVEQQTVNPNMFTEYQLSELISVLNQMGKNWNFDMFFVHGVTEGKSLSVAGRFCLSKFGLAAKFSISERTSTNYFQALEKIYKPNPYHNSCHGADVLNSTLFLYQNSEVITFMTDLEILGSVIAGLGHDVGHGALTNRFLVNNRDDLAVTYNDFSVLEMMHASITYSLMKSEDQNLLNSLDSESWVIVRKVVLKMILATDMSRHFELLGNFKSTHIAASTASLSKPDERLNIFEVCIKCADIGHAAKSLELHEKWTLLVCEEFYQQGDLEKKLGLPVSMYCDRETTDIAKVPPTQSQMGFIQNIVLPLFESLNVFLNSPAIASYCILQLKDNMGYWEKKTVRKRRFTIKTVEKPAEMMSEFEKLAQKVRPVKRG